jgi:hypothetical protein
VGLIILLYLCFRKLRISYGYATITNRRVVYYEFNEHVAENYHYVKSIYLADITALQFRIERTWFRKSFYMSVFTEFKALAVGGEKWLGLLSLFGKSDHLEPGPEALAFIQHVGGQIAAYQLRPPSGSKVGSI